MPIRTKYRDAIDLLNELKAKDINAWEEDGSLKLTAIVRNQHDLDLAVDKINELNYMNATDIDYDIRIEGN